MQVPEQWKGHEDDDEIRKEVGRRERREQIERVDALRQENPDRGPVPIPARAALENSREEESDEPGPYQANHGPAEEDEGSALPEDPLPEEEQRQLDQAERDLFRDLKGILVFLRQVFQLRGNGPVVHHRGVAGDGSLGRAADEYPVQRQYEDLGSVCHQRPTRKSDT